MSNESFHAVHSGISPSDRPVGTDLHFHSLTNLKLHIKKGYSHSQSFSFPSSSSVCPADFPHQAAHRESLLSSFCSVNIRQLWASLSNNLLNLHVRSNNEYLFANMLLNQQCILRTNLFLFSKSLWINASTNCLNVTSKVHMQENTNHLIGQLWIYECKYNWQAWNAAADIRVKYMEVFYFKM